MSTRASFKSLLAAVLPYALAGAGEDTDALYLLQCADVALRAAKERVQVRMREQYAANPEPAKARAKGRPGAPRQVRRERRDRRGDYSRRKEREYAQQRTASGKAARYREDNRERQRAWSVTRSANAGDDYARELLAKHSPISAKDFPQPLVELKKVAIKVKRVLK